ncbi:hypothetical protein NQ317_001928 [Molorchus minor]|uniref:ZAD domain-containing protein n=1 Tax=Molorchus minor TaxID=1323400 RepID=A0ABQ9JEF9_9CUCU|nr:hypothetical protein NQ317_001928 [Molorchus minor]
MNKSRQLILTVEFNDGYDYNIVEPLICRSCVGSLVNYLKFVTVCATTEETITKHCGQIDTNDQDLVESNGMFCNENECEMKLNIETNYRPTKIIMKCLMSIVCPV